MPIEIDFDLPFSLRVNGEFVLNTMGESFNVSLLTLDRVNATMPGAETIQGVAIVNDNTNMLSCTHVAVSYEPSDPHSASDPETFSTTGSELAVHIANALIAAHRMAYKEFHLEYFYSAGRLGPISFRVPSFADRKSFSAFYDGFQGGITFALPPRVGSETTLFAKALASGAVMTPASELLSDARRYLLQGNRRMALANLSISFEVGLADKLTEVAISRSDQSLEDEIARSSLNDLGTKLARQVLGHSFAEKKYWSGRFSDAFEWLRTARNGVLHKAQLELEYCNRRRDFNQTAELQQLFSERDWLFQAIEAAVARVLSGLPALP